MPNVVRAVKASLQGIDPELESAGYGVDPSIAAICTVVTGLALAAARRWVGFHRAV